VPNFAPCHEDVHGSGSRSTVLRTLNLASIDISFVSSFQLFTNSTTASVTRFYSGMLEHILNPKFWADAIRCALDTMTETHEIRLRQNLFQVQPIVAFAVENRKCEVISTLRCTVFVSYKRRVSNFPNFSHVRTLSTFCTSLFGDVWLKISL
jgi:hypothetical protein